MDRRCASLRPADAAAAARRRWREPAVAWGFATPALLLMVLLLFAPVAAVVAFSFTDWELGAATVRVVGAENYAALSGDPAFRASLLNTAVYALVVVAGAIGLGLAVALTIDAGVPCRGLFATIHFLPVMSMMVAMAIVWEVILHPTVGPLNALLGSFGIPPRNWLRDPDLVLPLLCVIGIWEHAGFAMVLFLAGLATIPRELYDAAAIDGASAGWDRFRTVTWPLLGPVAMFLFVMVAIRAFKVFETVFVLTQGGPGNASEVLLFSIYQEGFVYLRTGYASALTVVFLVIIMALTLVQAYLFDRRAHYA